LQQFNHVFSVISVNETADTGSFAWLKPDDQAYANIKTTDTAGLFGVLAMTGDRSRGTLPFSISPFAIPAGAPSGFLISSERFLTDLVSPAMPAAFEGATAADFELVNDTVLRNKKAMTVPIEADGKKYTGTIDARGFSLTVRGTELVLEMPKLMVNLSPGIDVEVDIHEYLNVTTKPRGDGTSVLWFEQKDSTVTHQVIYADWVQGLEIGAEIVAGILLSVFGFRAAGKFVEMGLSKIAARILAVIITMVIGGVVGAITNIPKWIAIANEKKFDQLPALETLLVKGLEAVEWPEASGFALKSAGMSKSLRIGLDPKFT
jgi:hypothetical protein